MNNKLILGRYEDKILAALWEDGEVTELTVLTEAGQAATGSIYLGRAVNRIPSLNALFVDIGLEKNAILSGERELALTRTLSAQFGSGELLVQLERLPVGEKGAILTSDVKLPGAHMVLMPCTAETVVSSRIADPSERARLTELAKRILPEGFGLIWRTAAQGEDEKELTQELSALLERWDAVIRRARCHKAPALLSDEGGFTRLVTDLTALRVNEILCQDGEICEQMEKALTLQGVTDIPLRAAQNSEDLFTVYGVNKAIREALSQRVYLKSGGFLVIDRTEAMTVIDVNSGSYAPKLSAKEAALSLNLEAAEEIARQLRLRDTGGIVIIDFIDMPKAAQGEELTRQLKLFLKRDRARSCVYGLTRLGLMEMSRKKKNEELGRLTGLKKK